MGGPWYTVFSFKVNRLFLDSTPAGSSGTPIAPGSLVASSPSAQLPPATTAAAPVGGGVNEFLRKQATATDDFSLSIIASNLPGDKAQLLRSFLIPKMSKGTLYSGTGQTAKLGVCLRERETLEGWMDG